MEAQQPLNDRRFKPLSGLKLVFDPCIEARESVKKHACPDCHFCQFCSDSRCHSCLGKVYRTGPSLKRKMSICEQIRLFDEINTRKQ